MMTHEQMFSEESDDDEFFGFESILLILVRLICGFDSREYIGLIHKYIQYVNYYFLYRSVHVTSLVQICC